jgi:hypothetical protein
LPRLSAGAAWTLPIASCHREVSPHLSDFQAIVNWLISVISPRAATAILFPCRFPAKPPTAADNFLQVFDLTDSFSHDEFQQNFFP